MKKRPLFLKISLFGMVLSILIFFVCFRYIQFLELDYFWNKGHLKLKEFYSEVDTIQVRNELDGDSIIAEIKGKEKVKELLDLIVFEPVAPVSFWRVPMLPKDFSLSVSFCMDYVRVWFIEDGEKVGYFWITSSCRELKSSPASNNLWKDLAHTEEGILTEESFQQVALWFLSHGMKHYVDPIVPKPLDTNQAGMETP